MTKKAVLDIGSLKIKVAIFDVETRKLIDSTSHLTLLGKNLEEKKRIEKDSLSMLDKALGSTAKTLTSDGITDTVIIGTEALRNAENVNEVDSLIKKYFPNHKLEIIDQEREADLFFQAVSREFSEHPIVAIDIGGGSVQVIKGHYNKRRDEGVIDKRYKLPTGTYKLQQQYSPHNDRISTRVEEANTIIRSVFEPLDIKAPVLVFGSSVMLDFVVASGIETILDSQNTNHPIYVARHTLVNFLEDLKQIQPDSRDHFFPDGGYFMYGADYLLMNLLAAIDKVDPDKIYPTNLNTSYAFI